MTKRTKAIIITASSLAAIGILFMALGSALGGSFIAARYGTNIEAYRKNDSDSSDSRHYRGRDDYYGGSEDIPFGGSQTDPFNDEFDEFFRSFGFGDDFFGDFFGGSPYDSGDNGSIHYY